MPLCLQLLFHRWGTDTLAHFQWAIKSVDCTNVIQDCPTMSFLSHISHRTQTKTSAEGKGSLFLTSRRQQGEIDIHRHSQLPQGLWPCRADTASTPAETSFWIPWTRLELSVVQMLPHSPIPSAQTQLAGIQQGTGPAHQLISQILESKATCLCLRASILPLPLPMH